MPGPGCLTVVGRVVNFYDRVNGSKMPRAAKGCLRCVVGDGTGFVVVGYSLNYGYVLDIITADSLGIVDSGQALVWQDRLQASTRALGDGVDATCFECGSGLGHESEWGCVDDVGVSGEG